MCLPITGTRAKRILHGVLTITTGDLLRLIPEVWDEVTHPYVLQMSRAHWRGRPVIVVEDRGSPHTAEQSVELAAELGIAIRFLPRATPKLKARAHLWRHVKGRA